MGKYQRTKGLGWERRVSQDLRPIFPEAKRHLEVQMQEAQGYDLDNTGDWRIQCKAMAKVPNMPKVFKEFTKLTDEQIPMVVFSVTNKGEYACVKWKDMLLLMQAWEQAKRPV